MNDTDYLNAEEEAKLKRELEYDLSGATVIIIAIFALTIIALIIEKLIDGDWRSALEVLPGIIFIAFLIHSVTRGVIRLNYKHKIWLLTRANKKRHTAQSSKSRSDHYSEKHDQRKHRGETPPHSKSSERKKTSDSGHFDTRQDQNEYNRKSNGSVDAKEKDIYYYGKILGLRGNTTMDDVRKRYIKLVSQYHPDKVNHLGEKLKALAESEMREINEAYEYFQKRHNK